MEGLISKTSPAFGRRAAAAPSPGITLPRVGWKTAGAAALLCSTVAWASLPSSDEIASAETQQWEALALAPASAGGSTGMAMAPTDAVQPVDFVPARAAVAQAPPTPPPPPPPATGPQRIRGRVGDGLYWSLRAAGASPKVTAEYLRALATEIDVGGDVAMGDSFDMVVGRDGELLYAGLDRASGSDLQLVHWSEGGRGQWIDAARPEEPTQVSSAMAWPVAGRITSYFGYRVHPILRFRRFHAGLDFGASWGSPIVAAADGQVVRAGWAGGYGRQVRLFHGGGMTTSYSHMSQIVAEPGSFVHAGQVIGYVGSSGLSTGPHLHYEVQQNGVPVNPLGVRFAATRIVSDHRVSDAVKARLKALLSVGVKRG